MRNSAVVVVAAFLVSLVGFSQSGVINEPRDEIAPFSIIDPIIKAILESMRPKVADVKLNDIDQTIRDPRLNATIKATDMIIKNLDTFNIKFLKSTLIPMKLTNLTLTWDEVNASGSYNVDASIINPQTKAPVRIFGEGKAKASLNGVFFTIGANIEMKDKAIQVKPKGFFGFDLFISKANVSISSLMGSQELGEAVGTFLSKALPELVNALKKPVFDAFHDDLVKYVNQILKSNGTSIFDDEEPQLPLEELDASEELDFSLPSELDLGDDEFDSLSSF